VLYNIISYTRVSSKWAQQYYFFTNTERLQRDDFPRSGVFELNRFDEINPHFSRFPVGQMIVFVFDDPGRGQSGDRGRHHRRGFASVVVARAGRSAVGHSLPISWRSDTRHLLRVPRHLSNLICASSIFRCRCEKKPVNTVIDTI